MFANFRKLRLGVCMTHLISLLPTQNLAFLLSTLFCPRLERRGGQKGMKV